MLFGRVAPAIADWGDFGSHALKLQYDLVAKPFSNILPEVPDTNSNIFSSNLDKLESGS